MQESSVKPTIQTLENTALEDIVTVFNESFSDYIVPLKLNREQLENKIKSDSIRLELSVGAFENDRLQAFILHGYDLISNEQVAYNAGTGVVPSRRGSGLTRQLYGHMLPTLRSMGISKIQLEVITDNYPAINTYQKIGFQTSRILNCYKGIVDKGTTSNDFLIQNLDRYDWATQQSFWDWEPSWQNSVTAAGNLQKGNASFGVYCNQTLLGYIIFNPLSRRVLQFAVDKNHRGKGIGKQLFHHLGDVYGGVISVINVDESSKESAQLMRSAGLHSYVRQFEMEMMLKCP